MELVKLEFYKDKDRTDKPDDTFDNPIDNSIQWVINNWYEMYPNGLVKVNNQKVGRAEDSGAVWS